MLSVEHLGTPSEVAVVLRTTPQGLAQMRHRRTGPPFMKCGSRVLYRWQDVEDWLDRSSTDGAKQPR